MAGLLAVCIFKLGAVYSKPHTHRERERGQWCGLRAQCGILAKETEIAARKVSKVAQKVQVRALVWSSGCSGWVETRRKR